MMRILFISLLFTSLGYANVLQDAIDKAPAGSSIKLSTGLYIGRIVINKPISIIAQDKDVVIDGNNSGTTITINSSNVTLKNLTIINSGGKMQNLDSAIFMKNVQNCEILYCKILNSLYGIDMVMVSNSTISNNYITSKKENISLRGDALKIWYSNNNIIKNNTIDKVRDTTLTYSNHNIIKNNTFTNNRFGLHLSLSNNNIIKNNSFSYNSVAILVMGAKDTNVTNNVVRSSKGAAGIGVVIKGVSNFLLQNNQIKYNAKAIYIDSKSTEIGMQRYIKDNTISYNKEAIHFHTIIKNNTITHNNIFSNIDDIVKDTKGNDTHSNIIQYNYWGKYAGFESNGTNIGSTPYTVYLYADQLWNFHHHIKFFYASPIMSLMDFLTRLAPFVEPELLLEDKYPLINIED